MAPAMRTRTKHINVKYHHFRQYVADGTIDIQSIQSENQPADILTKPLAENLFSLHRTTLMGWGHDSPSQPVVMATPITTTYTAMAAISRQANLGGGQVPPSRDPSRPANLEWGSQGPPSRFGHVPAAKAASSRLGQVPAAKAASSLAAGLRRSVGIPLGLVIPASRGMSVGTYTELLGSQGQGRQPQVSSSRNQQQKQQDMLDSLVTSNYDSNKIASQTI